MRFLNHDPFQPLHLAPGYDRANLFQLLSAGSVYQVLMDYDEQLVSIFELLSGLVNLIEDLHQRVFIDVAVSLYLQKVHSGMCLDRVHACSLSGRTATPWV